VTALAEAAALATAPARPLVALRGLAKRFGGLTAVHPLDLEIAAGDFCAILGPSGCGKSTLLRMIAGFAEPSAGRVEIGGRDVTRLGPETRPTNMVFQSYGLFPHLTVGQNVGFGLALRRTPVAQTAGRVAEALRLVRLEGFEERPIDALSGGQQQRVALARALILRPQVLLLDEPLAALDLKLRQAMQEELRRIHREIGGTFVFVTHDQTEAFALANRIVVMNAGRIEQAGAPEQVYREPASLFVAGFVGEANVLAGRREGGVVALDAGLRFPAAGPDGPVCAVLRPERVRRSALGVEGRIVELVFLGDALRATAELASGETLRLREPDGRGAASFRIGDAVRLAWDPGDLRVFEAER
jgi:ABC-type Fe3+/spermidine/putrescine transport system ATPase subunit